MTVPTLPPAANGGVLIVGGYGHVGSRIAARLLEGRNRPVGVAGRDAVKAQRMAGKLGAEAVVLDLGSPTGWADALESVACVIMCVDQADTGFAAFVLQRGLIYIDITADDTFLRKVEGLDALARSHGGSAVLSVGLAPGLTNLLVKACAGTMSEVENARIGVLLGIGDAHGPAAIDWTLRTFGAIGAQSVETIRFGTHPILHPAIPFDFADQHVVGRTLGITDVRTLLTFDTPLISRALFAMLPRIVSSKLLRSVVRGAMSWVRLGSDRAALSIEVRGKRAGAQAVASATLDGRKEADITALVAARVTLEMMECRVSPGVHHIEQVMSIKTLAPDLAAAGIQLELPADHLSSTTSQTN